MTDPNDLLPEFDEPIDQSFAEQVYRDSDVGIAIRNPLTRESYTLYGPHALDVLKRRKKQGFVVVGTDPLEPLETLSVDDSSASGDILDVPSVDDTGTFPPVTTENVTSKTPKKMGEAEEKSLKTNMDDNKR